MQKIILQNSHRIAFFKTLPRILCSLLIMYGKAKRFDQYIERAQYTAFLKDIKWN